MRTRLADHVTAIIFLLGCATGLSASDNAGHQDPATTTVKVCAFHAVDECYDDYAGMGRQAGIGTTVTLYVNHPGGRLLKFNDEASTITTFEDDKGKVLLRVAPYDIPRLIFGHSSPTTISRDGHSAVIDLKARDTPTKGAHEISIEGTLVFKEASKTRTVSKHGFSLESGKETTIGHIRVKIDSVRRVKERGGDPHLDWGRTQVYVDLLTEGQDPDSIESVRLVDAKGQTLSQPRGEGYHRRNQKVTGTFTLLVPDGVRSGKLEIAYWADMRQLEVPVALTVTAGL